MMPASSCAIYLDKGILEKDPFVSIDQIGVGSLVKIAFEKGRSVKPHLKVGICGEHGGDPDSIGFCHKVGSELRVLLTVPGSDCAPCSSAGRDLGKAG